MVVDGMENAFMDTFMAHPERFFVFLPDRTMVYKAQPRGGEFQVSDLTDWIVDFLKRPAAMEKVGS